MTTHTSLYLTNVKYTALDFAAVTNSDAVFYIMATSKYHKLLLLMCLKHLLSLLLLSVKFSTAVADTEMLSVS